MFVQITWLSKSVENMELSLHVIHIWLEEKLNTKDYNHVTNLIINLWIITYFHDDEISIQHSERLMVFWKWSSLTGTDIIALCRLRLFKLFLSVLIKTLTYVFVDSHIYVSTNSRFTESIWNGIKWKRRGYGFQKNF